MKTFVEALEAWRALDVQQRNRFYSDLDSVKSWERDAFQSTHDAAVDLLTSAAEPPTFPDTPENFALWVKKSLAGQEDGDAEVVIEQVERHDPELAHLLMENTKAYRAVTEHLKKKYMP